MAPRADDLPPRIILIDGTCVFCNRLVSFLIRHDPEGQFHFAHLQSELSREMLARTGGPPGDVDGVYLLVGAGTDAPKLYVDGAAGRDIWPRLFRAAVFLRYVPLPLLDLGYRLFARVRYRLFGRYDVCHVPTAEERRRLVV